jgi:hypothetical protein
MSKTDYSGLLFANPSVLDGYARVLDIGGTFDDYNYAATTEEADRLAVASDWYAVGAELYRSIQRYAGRVGFGINHVRRSNP